MWAYQCLDIIVTLSECFTIYLFGKCFCKDPRFTPAVNKGLIIGVYFAVVYILTWFSALGASKLLLALFLAVILLKICYRDSVYQCMTAMEMTVIVCFMLSESLAGFIGDCIYGDSVVVQIEGNFLYRWEIYVITLFIWGLSLFGIYRLCSDLRCQISTTDFLIITLVWGTGFAVTVFDIFHFMDKHIVLGSLVYIMQIVFSVLFVLLFLYVKNILYLREQEQRNKMRIAQLQQQFAYYQEKQKDAEKVRSLYHDIKNHLLVLEGSADTEAARTMAQQLRAQIAGYEDYVHTGNSFLDIIIKDKAEKMREKQIDFTALLHFEAGSFIEPLDISTIFGNALDNAIEASEKLPVEKRMITVKAACIRDMLVISIENNTVFGTSAAGETTKTDRFLHGLGIPNIIAAVEKYGGQCSFRQEQETYLLKILIPVP